MGNNSSRTETINWDKIKTENIDTPNLYLGSNFNNANNLITKLNLPKELLKDNLDTETEIDLLDKKILNNNFNLSEFNSSTSPFISSEKYLSLSKKLENSLNLKGGGLDDESSTSETDNNSEEIKNKNKNKFKSVLSELSYVSSSAHTGNEQSEEDDDDSNEETENNLKGKYKSEQSEEDDDSNEETENNLKGKYKSEQSEEDDDDSNEETENNLKGKYKSEQSEEDDDDSDEETENNLKGKYKSEQSEEDDDDSDEETENNLKRKYKSEQTENNSSTVYSTTIDNEVNTSDINII
jgi:hypothetical protein